MNERLRDYHGKRDFARTGGPQGREGPTGAKPRFVVQIHDASALHSPGHGTPDPRRARSVRTGRTLAQVAAEEN